MSNPQFLEAWATRLFAIAQTARDKGQIEYASRLIKSALLLLDKAAAQKSNHAVRVESATRRLRRKPSSVNRRAKK